jgi:hypothetical protein
MVQPESEREDHLSSDDDINTKLPAVTDENLVDIAKMCLEKSKQAERKYVHGIVDNGLNLRPYDKIDKYQQKVSKAGEEDMMCDPSIMKTYVTEKLVRSANARLGLCQMADVCLSIVDLFCLCKIDIFSGVKKDGGISKYIRLLMGR